MIDPNGRCGEGLAAAAVDQCSSIDPNSRCGGGSSVTSDQGPWIDPNGGSSDQGLWIDPDG
jgi:hypothetical protein